MLPGYENPGAQLPFSTTGIKTGYFGSNETITSCSCGVMVLLMAVLKKTRYWIALAGGWLSASPEVVCVTHSVQPVLLTTRLATTRAVPDGVVSVQVMAPQSTSRVLQAVYEGDRYPPSV